MVPVVSPVARGASAALATSLAPVYVAVLALSVAPVTSFALSVVLSVALSVGTLAVYAAHAGVSPSPSSSPALVVVVDLAFPDEFVSEEGERERW